MVIFTMKLKKNMKFKKAKLVCSAFGAFARHLPGNAAVAWRAAFFSS